MRRPQNGLLTLFIVLAIAWVLGLVVSPVLFRQLSAALSIFRIFKLIVGAILPEIASLIILMALINVYHDFINIKKLDLSFKSVALYEIKFLPLFVVAFFVFFPITLHIRFLLREFPEYSLNKYYDLYLANGFSLNTYLFYLPFVCILGYALLNVSVITDLSIITNDKSETPENPTKEEMTLPDETIDSPEPLKTYIHTVNGKIERYNKGVSLPVEDCFYFLATEKRRYYIAAHTGGSFKIETPMYILEKQLDPQFFFRCNRKVIINLNYVASFIYSYNGVYVINMKTPTPMQFSVTKERIKALREVLKSYNIQPQSEAL